METLIEKMSNADAYVVLTVVNVEGTFKVKIDFSESMTPEIVDDLLIKVTETIKNRKA